MKTLESTSGRVLLIRRTINDAYQFIHHLSRRGVKLDKGKVEIVTNIAKLSDAEIEDIDDAEFWDAFRYLADRASPTTVESLKIVAPLQPLKESSSLRPFGYLGDIRIFLVSLSFLSIIVFGLLIIRLHSVAEVDGYLNSLKRLSAEAARLESGTVLGTSFETSSTPPPQYISIAKSNVDLEIMQTFCSLYTLLGDKERGVAVRRLGKVVPTSGGDSSVEGMPCVKAMRNREMTGYITSHFGSEIRFNQSYYIPILLAILGSCVSILRKTSTQVYNYTIGYVSLPLTLQRISVGAIAGVGIGWIYRDSGAGISLTPIALSFLAGYAVEILFSILDRLTATFTDPMSVRDVSARKDHSRENI